MASNLALEAPQRTIAVEDTIANKVGEDRVEAAAFGVVGKVRFKDMVDNLRVCCGDASGTTKIETESKGGGAVKEAAAPLV